MLESFSLLFRMLLFGPTKLIALSIIPNADFSTRTVMCSNWLQLHMIFKTYLVIFLSFLVLKAYQIPNRTLIKFRANIAMNMVPAAGKITFISAALVFFKDSSFARDLTCCCNRDMV